MVDLLKKKVCIKDPYFLQFFYPHFAVVSDLNQDIDYSNGIIYNGLITDTVIKKIEYITRGRYILISDLSDIKVETVVDYIKVFYPALESKAEKYSNYSLEDFIPLLKANIIVQKRIPILKEEELTIYSLFDATTQPKQLDVIYFNLLKENDIRVLVSSFLSFLIKVDDEDYSSIQSALYKKLINKAHTRYGMKIKKAIMQYIESDQIPEFAFWSLLHTLAD